MEDDNSQDAKLLGSLLRHRSPTFSKEEVQCLINLIEKYKNIILHKSINNTACQAKELAWTQLTEAFNSQGFKHTRSTENIKGKWDNLKKEARRLSKNLTDPDCVGYDDIIMSQIVSLLIAAESETCETKDISGELKVVLEDEIPNHDVEKCWDENTDKEMNISSESADIKKRAGIKRSTNFTPHECSILLHCVRPEKKIIFDKLTTSKASKLKHQAWIRVTRSFNKLSPQKRSTKMLQNKLINMKRRVKNEARSFFAGEKSYTKLEDKKPIKKEPIFDSEDEPDEDDDDQTNDDEDNMPINSFSRLHSHNSKREDAPDPLSTILSSDSGFCFKNNDAAKPTEDNKEVTKLKLELLQYQMETAKLERERLERAMSAEALAIETRAIEASLRLRSARLEAIAAAMKLASDHPALEYTPEESRARNYLNQYHLT